MRLEDQVCEECKHGRTKLRPGLVQVCLRNSILIVIIANVRRAIFSGSFSKSFISGRDLRRLNVPRVLHGRVGDTEQMEQDLLLP